MTHRPPASPARAILVAAGAADGAAEEAAESQGPEQASPPGSPPGPSEVREQGAVSGIGTPPPRGLHRLPGPGPARLSAPAARPSGLVPVTRC